MSRRTIHRAMLLTVSALGVLAIFSSSAFAAPVIKANTPTQSALNIVRVTGTIEGATKYRVEYGKTKLYGKSTPSLKVGEANAFSAELVGLEPRSTYHYRIVTEGAEVTETSDALFETLLSWKVEGARVEEAPVSFEDKYSKKAGEGGYIEFRGEPLAIPTRIYCHQSSHSTGIFNTSYSNVEFNNCFTQLNGVENANCKPTETVVLHLNGFFAMTEPTTIRSTEKCAIGQTMTFKEGGLSPVLGGSEAVEQNNFSLYGPFYGQGNFKEWEVDYAVGTFSSPGGWKLSGTNAGKKFGIS